MRYQILKPVLTNAKQAISCPACNSEVSYNERGLPDLIERKGYIGCHACCYS